MIVSGTIASSIVNGRLTSGYYFTTVREEPVFAGTWSECVQRVNDGGAYSAIMDARGLEVPECLDRSEGCGGDVEPRLLPDRDDFKAFPRCERHFEIRLAAAERNMELLSPAAPEWFDPGYAGERWDEDY